MTPFFYTFVCPECKSRKAPGNYTELIPGGVCPDTWYCPNCKASFIADKADFYAKYARHLETDVLILEAKLTAIYSASGESILVQTPAGAVLVSSDTGTLKDQLNKIWEIGKQYVSDTQD